jgi:transposase
MPLVDAPNEIITDDPGCCGGCGADLAGTPVVVCNVARSSRCPYRWRRGWTEYRIVTRACVACGARATATPPGCPPARVQYGPTVAARAAELVYAHYLPVARATRLMMRSMLGVGASTGFAGGVRHRAAQLLTMPFGTRRTQHQRRSSRSARRRGCRPGHPHLLQTHTSGADSAMTAAIASRRRRQSPPRPHSVAPASDSTRIRLALSLPSAPPRYAAHTNRTRSTGGRQSTTRQPSPRRK